MANENEPAKLLLPYLQRADELQKHEPLVAYYCIDSSSSSHNFTLNPNILSTFSISVIKLWFIGKFWFSGRLYAMERGLKIPSSERTKTTSSLLVSLMKQLEKVRILL